MLSQACKVDEKMPSLPKDNVFTDPHMAIDGVSQTAANASGFECEIVRKPRWTIKDLQKLLSICLHSSSSKTICSAVWWDPVKR